MASYLANHVMAAQYNGITCFTNTAIMANMQNTTTAATVTYTTLADYPLLSLTT